MNADTLTLAAAKGPLQFASLSSARRRFRGESTGPAIANAPTLVGGSDTENNKEIP